MYQSRVHDSQKLLDSWHSLQQSAVNSIFAPAYRPKEDILSSDNMLIE